MKKKTKKYFYLKGITSWECVDVIQSEVSWHESIKDHESVRQIIQLSPNTLNRNVSFDTHGNMAACDIIKPDHMLFEASGSLECVKTNPQSAAKDAAVSNVGDIEIHTCDDCRRTSVDKDELTSHWQAMHGVGPFACMECAELFSEKNDLDAHFLTHIPQHAIPNKTDFPLDSGYKKYLEDIKLEIRKNSNAGQFSERAILPCTISETQRNLSMGPLVSQHSHADVPSSLPPGECSRASQEITQVRDPSVTNDPFLCGNCGEMFPTDGHLIAHIRNVHNSKPFKCEYCPEKFAYKTDLIKHLQSHTTSECLPPPDTIPSSSSLKVKTEPSDKPDPKSENGSSSESQANDDNGNCTSTFSVESQLDEQTQDHLDTKPHICIHCGEAFTCYEEFTEHSRLHKEDSETPITSGSGVVVHPFSCTFCDMVFPRKNILTVHLKNYHNAKPIPCKHCSETFSSHNDLKKHLHVHTSAPVVQPKVCPYCPKTFAKKAQLQMHLSVHADLNPFACHVCSQSFKTNNELKSHKEDHANAGERIYACTQFPKSFATAGSLRAHRTLTHRTDKPYPCTECNKSFKSSNNLKTHLRIHSGLKPYKCEICQMEFTQMSHMKKHVLSHTEDKPYRCCFCDRRFSRANNLKNTVNSEGKRLYVCTYCRREFPDGNVPQCLNFPSET